MTQGYVARPGCDSSTICMCCWRASRMTASGRGRLIASNATLRQHPIFVECVIDTIPLSAYTKGRCYSFEKLCENYFNKSFTTIRKKSNIIVMPSVHSLEMEQYYLFVSFLFL